MEESNAGVYDGTWKGSGEVWLLCIFVEQAAAVWLTTKLSLNKYKYGRPRIFLSLILAASTTQRKVEQQVKVLIKNLAIFFLFPSKKFLPISFQNSAVGNFSHKQKEQRQKQLGFDKLVTTQIWKLKN